jgi:hypothetical protein
MKRPRIVIGDGFRSAVSHRPTPIVDVIGMILDHELRSRPSVRCLIPTTAIVRRAGYGKGPAPGAGSRIRRH